MTSGQWCDLPILKQTVATGKINLQSSCSFNAFFPSLQLRALCLPSLFSRLSPLFSLIHSPAFLATFLLCARHLISGPPSPFSLDLAAKREQMALIHNLVKSLTLMRKDTDRERERDGKKKMEIKKGDQMLRAQNVTRAGNARAAKF